MCPEVLVELVLSQQDQSGWCFGVCSGQRLCAVSYCPLQDAALGTSWFSMPAAARTDIPSQDHSCACDHPA